MKIVSLSLYIIFRWRKS